VHTFERLRLLADSTGLHSSLADYAVIESVIAIDEGTVRFVLGRPDSDFLALLARDAAAILSDGTRDPSTEWVGTGPFVLWSYRAGEGAVLRRNPAYWARDAGGRQLPYVDGLNVVFKSDPETRLAELVAGRVQFVGGLDLADIRLVDATPGLTTLRTPSNEHLSIYIESGPGRVGEDVRVRRALKLGTDRAALAEAVRPSLSTPGNDSPVGPFYGERHLDEVPEYNPEAAGLLLTEAGIVDGLKLVLDVPDDPEAAALAQAWAAQMEMIGVTVEIRDATSGAGGGVDGATADARIARSISAPSPFDSLVHAYAVGVDSAAGIWVDADFEALVAQLAAETDEILQVDLYHQIQQVLIERGPAVVPFYETVVAGAGKTLLGVSVAPYWPRTSFRTASFGS